MIVRTLVLLIFSTIGALTVGVQLTLGASPASGGTQQADAQVAQKRQVPERSKLTPDDSLKKLRLKVDEYPRVGGSTSAHPLGVLAAARLTGSGWLWASDPKGNRRLIPVRRTFVWGFGPLGITLSRQDQPLVPALNVPPLHGLKDDYVIGKLKERTWHNGTHGDYKRLVKGDVDFIIECRKPSEDELQLMKKADVSLEIVPVALDAFVFLLNEKNPLDGVTLQQIREIPVGNL